MNGTLSFICGFGLGAGVLYLFDPDVGRRHRTMLRDRLRSAASGMGCHLKQTARDAGHRTQGLVAEARARLRHEEVSDDVVRERVRAQIGHVVSHAHAIEVAVRAGQVTLRGPILSRELQCALVCVDAVPGVTGLENQLDVHTRADIAALRGGTCRRRTGWPAAARLVAGGIGCGLMANCLAQRTTGAALLGTLGFGLFVRAVTNMDTGRLFGTRTTGRPGTSGRRPVMAMGTPPTHGNAARREPASVSAGS
jgi:hypothetical protein